MCSGAPKSISQTSSPSAARCETALSSGEMSYTSEVTMSGGTKRTGPVPSTSPAVLVLTNVAITTNGGAGSTIYGNDSAAGPDTELVYTDLVLSDQGTPQFDLRFESVTPPSDVVTLTTLSGTCTQSGSAAPVCTP